jgi:hypothetical protein
VKAWLKLGCVVATILFIAYLDEVFTWRQQRCQRRAMGRDL